MDQLTARQLSRETSDALDRVERGETLEIRRGRRTIAKLVPVVNEPTPADRKRLWDEHEVWLRSLRRGEPKPKGDAVEELMTERRRRREYLDGLLR